MEHLCSCTSPCADWQATTTSKQLFLSFFLHTYIALIHPNENTVNLKYTIDHTPYIDYKCLCCMQDWTEILNWTKRVEQKPKKEKWHKIKIENAPQFRIWVKNKIRCFVVGVCSSHCLHILLYVSERWWATVLCCCPFLYSMSFFSLRLIFVPELLVFLTTNMLTDTPKGINWLKRKKIQSVHWVCRKNIKFDSIFVENNWAT